MKYLLLAVGGYWLYMLYAQGNGSGPGPSAGAVATGGYSPTTVSDPGPVIFPPVVVGGGGDPGPVSGPGSPTNTGILGPGGIWHPANTPTWHPPFIQPIETLN